MRTQATEEHTYQKAEGPAGRGGECVCMRMDMRVHGHVCAGGGKPGTWRSSVE